jgi:hypothetical protein
VASAAFQYRSVINMRSPMPNMTRMMATAAAAATTSNVASHQSYFTYRLGQSIYVPLTCRCNSRTLPQLRGDSFTLPVSVVAALCRVRDVEMLGNSSQQEQQQAWWWDDDNDDFLNKRQGGISQKLSLPPYPLETVATLPAVLSSDYDQQQREPTIDDLYQEIQQQLLQEQQQQSRDEDKNDTTTIIGRRIDSIVLSGEGEPTLRFDDMLELVQWIKSFTTNTLPLSSSQQQQQQQQQQTVAIRLTTNGLVTATTTTNNNNSNISIPQRLKDCGISQVSVGLMTWDAKQYNDLVRPVLPRATKNNYNPNNNDDPKNNDNDDTTTVDAFDIMCKFITDAVQVHGLDVETTAVDRPDVDKVKTEMFASKTLGVTNPVRWRPYFS